MFLIKAGTVIEVEAPKPKTTQYFYWCGWRPYTTKEDKIYDKEEVFDAVTLHNAGDYNFPQWLVRNIELGKTVIHRDGRWALVNPKDIQYLD